MPIVRHLSSWLLAQRLVEEVHVLGGGLVRLRFRARVRELYRIRIRVGVRGL